MIPFGEKIVYQVYPKSFKDSNNDGFGDLSGIVEKLDYLKDLGIDYIWITPFFLSPQKDNGYDISSYTKIDPEFGSMKDFELLVKEADKRNIGIMLDMVFNHTSTEHIWFQNALDGDKKYQNYYIFKEAPKDKAPTNWVSKFGGSAWEYSKRAGKWYLHLFDVSQADLNWENPEVREELKNIIFFWKSKGVRGFRFDVINLISKPDVFEDDNVGDGRRFYTDGKKVHQYLKELVRDTGIKDYITVGEMSSTSIKECIKYSNPGEKELSMCFNFHHLKVDYKDGDKWKLMAPDIASLKSIFKEWQEKIQSSNGLNALFWCNHDQPRIVSRLGDEGKYYKESAKMLAGLIHLMRGTPYIYQGEEIGMTDPHFKSIDMYRDVESLNYYKILMEQGLNSDEALTILDRRSRDNSRTPMQWSAKKNAGFSKVSPWINVADNYKSINVENEKDDKDSILSFYKKLITIRKENTVISAGNISFIDTNENIIAYKRSLGERKILVFCNMSNKDESLDIDLDGFKKLIGNYGELNYIDKNLRLSPYEFVAVEN
ncbi:alpha,alpha-phosphotrehalase [Lachnoanaerobaculum saburreum F0468]|uniref:Alpha,alpha-phosphotrehalase n=1 Tax=Lachnoanaerobaculum saburreum F0468 TaxID=1095750 RepID=I0R590_9FIRM|nr:alpha,alpha-phosphotrehalase [Lachnoanaerobaculum saburreum]EIC94848.1 alpha,alpha-phosphotrehalase [Lachnoanaerobaculum saburreum F0468]